MPGWDWLAALVLFEFATGFTPGPNNLLALAIGFGHGFRRAIPHIMGVTLGFPLMLLAIGLFVRPLMERMPLLFELLRYASLAFVLYLAWKVATAPVGQEHSAQESSAPVTFGQSLLLQWINPKAWAAALSIVTLYTRPEHFTSDLFAAAFVTIFMLLPAVSLWAVSGRVIQRFLRRPRSVRRFNRLMATLLVLSVGMMLFESR